MAMQNIYVRARVDQSLKDDSEAIFRRLGLTTSEAVRLFLAQVSIRRGLPFEVVLPEEDGNDDLLRTPRMRQAALDSVYDD